MIRRPKNDLEKIIMLPQQQNNDWKTLFYSNNTFAWAMLRRNVKALRNIPPEMVTLDMVRYAIEIDAELITDAPLKFQEDDEIKRFQLECQTKQRNAPTYNFTQLSSSEEFQYLLHQAALTEEVFYSNQESQFKAVKKIPRLFRYLPQEDPELVIKFLNTNPEVFYFMDREIRKNPIVIARLIYFLKNRPLAAPWAICAIPESTTEFRDLALKLLELNSTCWRFVGRTSLRDDPKFIREAIDRNFMVVERLDSYSFTCLFSDIKSDRKAVARRGIIINPYAKAYIASKLEEYKDCDELPDDIFSLIQLAIQYASEKRQTEEQFLMPIFKRPSRFIGHLKMESLIRKFKHVRKIMLAVLTEKATTWNAEDYFNLLPEEFKKDFDFLVEVAKENFYIFRCGPKNIERYSKVVLAVIKAMDKEDWEELYADIFEEDGDDEVIDQSLKNDREFCIELVSMYPDKLPWVSVDISNKSNLILYRIKTDAQAKIIKKKLAAI